MKSKIQRGISLYSFQEEMFLGQMTVEDVIAFSASLGYYDSSVSTFPTRGAYTVTSVPWPNS